MSRSVLVAAAQMGPVTAAEPRTAVVARLIELLRESTARHADLVVFPEAALTPFFPHWLVSDDAELDAYFEHSMPNVGVEPLFDEAARLGVGFCLGYAERTMETCTTGSGTGNRCQQTTTSSPLTKRPRSKPGAGATHRCRQARPG